MEAPEVESSASIRIFGKGLDFSAISSGLGVEASRTHRAGQLARTSKPYPDDLWSFDSQLPKSESLDSHLKYIEKQVTRWNQSLRRIMSNEHVERTDVFCGIITDNECDFSISADSLTFLPQLGIEMELSLVFVGSPASQQVSTKVRDPHPVEIESESDEGQKIATELRIVGTVPDMEDLPETLRLKKVPADGQEMDSSQDVHWALRVPSSVGNDLGSQLQWLDMEITHLPGGIARLQGRTRSINCEVLTQCAWGSLWLSPNALRVPNELGASLQLHAVLV